MKYHLSFYKEMKIIQPAIFLRLENPVEFQENFSDEKCMCFNWVLQVHCDIGLHSAFLWSLKQLQGGAKLCLCLYTHMCTLLFMYPFIIYLFSCLTLEFSLHLKIQMQNRFWNVWVPPKPSAQGMTVCHTIGRFTLFFLSEWRFFKEEMENQWPHFPAFVSDSTSRTYLTVLSIWHAPSPLSLAMSDHLESRLLRAQALGWVLGRK